MNNVSLSGRLVRDPDCKEFEDGKTVCDFTLAVNGYREDDTVFVKVKAWANRAKSCSKYCSKGSLINVSGSLRGNSWTAKDGTKRREIYLLANDVEFVQLGGESKVSEDKSSNEEKLEPAKNSEVEDYDSQTVPF